MTDKQQALRDLMEKVVAGDDVAVRETIIDDVDGFPHPWLNCGRIMKGSTDAALALHNAMLPEYILQFDTQGDAWIYIPYRNGPATNPQNHTIEGKPALAALVCILKALIAKGEA